MSRFPRLPAWFARIINVLVLTAALSGCSAIRLAYNQSPMMLHWWLDDYADFDAEQSKQLRDQLKALQSWHRSQELPLYVNLLAEVQQLAQGPVSHPQICQIYEQFRPRLQRLSEEAATGLAVTAPLLKPEQLAAIAKQFDKTNRKWRKEWLDITRNELLELRVKKNREQLEDFYGPLSEQQISVLRQLKAASEFDPRKAWTERLQRQDELLQVLRQQSKAKNPDQVVADIRAHLRRQLIAPDTPYRSQSELRLREGCRSIAAVHNIASAEQRQHLMHKLQDYQADLRALAAQANKS
ncbi:MAG: DUF6279 family lipoprotein [Hylemonella sp.]|jgi:hypothetical protein